MCFVGWFELNGGLVAEELGLLGPPEWMSSASVRGGGLLVSSSIISSVTTSENRELLPA